MAIDIKFDLVGNPEPPTIILANRNGNKLGQLRVNDDSISLIGKFNDASEFSFTINKYIDDAITPLWEKIVDFKLVYCKEWDMWFEIKVELDEATETVKTVFCTQLGQAELSQIMLYNIEINTEVDIERDDYILPTVLYRENGVVNEGITEEEAKELKKLGIPVPYKDYKDASLLHRLLKDKAPHYSIGHVDSTIKRSQRSFSFDSTSICDAFQEIGEEIGCLFDYPSNSGENGKIQRTISVYDLQQNCDDCGHRGEFTDNCPKCGSANINYNEDVFKDTLIFVTSDELATEGIQLTTDADSVKNCFKIEAGDDLMTATVRNCNPNGSDYIWYFSDSLKEDMSEKLVEKLKLYDELYDYYYNDNIVFEEYNSEPELLGEPGIDFDRESLPPIGSVVRFVCNIEDSDKALVYYENDDNAIKMISFKSILKFNEIGNPIYDLRITEDIKSITTNQYVSTYLTSIVSQYNDMVSKYAKYKDDLQRIETPIKGYSSLMNVYYDVVDLSLYLESGLMPNVEMIDTSAEEQANLLMEFLMSDSFRSVATNNDYINSISLSTANSAILSMAKTIVNPIYKVEINNSIISDVKTDKEMDKYKLWSGNFVITNYSNEEDSVISADVSVKVNIDKETYTKQLIEKSLNKDNTDDLSVSGLFKLYKDEEHIVGEDVDCGCDFCTKLKEYAVNPLKSFYDACESCLSILINQGAGNKVEKPDLYKNLYEPYRRQSAAIAKEIKVREEEIAVIDGVWEKNVNEEIHELIIKGLRQYIEECRNEIQNILNFEKYIDEDLWLEFCAYRRDDKYSNENYISDGLNNAELFKRALELYEVAENEIYKSAELQHSISTSLNNLLTIDKFKPLVDSFKLGNWIRVRVDDKIFKLRLLEYEIDFGNFENISVEFSDMTKVKNGVSDVKDIMEQSSSMATSYPSVQKQASQGAKSNTVLNNWVENGLNATQTKIVDGYDENLMFGKNSFWCRQYDPITGTYGDEQIKIINSTIAITDDNWKTTKTAIGKYYYVDPTTGELKSAYGVNGETIVGKFILGEKMSLQNESGSMKFDGNGFTVIIATEDGKGAMTFNEDGLMVNHGENTVTISPKSEEVMNITNGEEKVFNISEDGELSINGNIMARSLKLESGVKIDSGVITDLATVATTGSYDDLVNIPNIPTRLSDLSNDEGFITKDANNLTNYYKKTEIDNLLSPKANTSDLSAVATTGSYNDLVDIDELKDWISQQIQSAINQQTDGS